MSRYRYRPPNYPLRTAVLVVVLLLAAIGAAVNGCEPPAPGITRTAPN
jgi:hypothetical protein